MINYIKDNFKIKYNFIYPNKTEFQKIKLNSIQEIYLNTINDNNLNLHLFNSYNSEDIFILIFSYIFYYIIKNSDSKIYIYGNYRLQDYFLIQSLIESLKELDYSLISSDDLNHLNISNGCNLYFRSLCNFEKDLDLDLNQDLVFCFTFLIDDLDNYSEDLIDNIFKKIHNKENIKFILPANVNLGWIEYYKNYYGIYDFT